MTLEETHGNSEHNPRSQEILPDNAAQNPPPRELPSRDRSYLEDVPLGNFTLPPAPVERSVHSAPQITIVSSGELLLQDARVKLFDVDHTLLVLTLMVVHDGILGRHARAASEIVKEKLPESSLPADRKSELMCRYIKSGLIFTESEWEERYRKKHTGISEVDTCLGISRQLAEDYGISVSMKEFHHRTGAILREQLHLFISQTGPTPGSLKLVEQIERMMDLLTAVVTGSPDFFVEPGLKTHGLGRLLDSRGNVFEASKKSAAPIEKSLRMLGENNPGLGFNASDAVMFGDQVTDALAACLAGLQVVILIPDTEDFNVGAAALERKLLSLAAVGAFPKNLPFQQKIYIIRSLDQVTIARRSDRSSSDGVKVLLPK